MKGPEKVLRAALKRATEDLGNVKAYQDRDQKKIRERGAEIRKQEQEIRDLRRALGLLETE